MNQPSIKVQSSVPWMARPWRFAVVCVAVAAVLVGVIAIVTWPRSVQPANHQPTNTAAGLIGVPLGATVTTVRQDRPASRWALNASQARSVVSTIASLPVAAPGSYACPADNGATDTVVFTTQEGGNATVVANVGGCADVTVRSPRGQVTLSDYDHLIDQRIRAVTPTSNS